MTRRRETETIELPHEYVQFADLRIDAIIRAAVHDRNIIASIARSCYLQGLWDGCQLAIAKPELLDQLKERS